MAFIRTNDFLGKKVYNNQIITTELGYFEVGTEFKVVHEDKSDITDISRVVVDEESGIQMVLNNECFMKVMKLQHEKDNTQEDQKVENDNEVKFNQGYDKKADKDKTQEEILEKLSEDCGKVIDYVKNMTVRDISRGEVPVYLEKTADEILENLTRLFSHECDMISLHKSRNDRK